VSLRRQLRIPTIFATGELEEAYEIGDRIALFEGGSIVQTDEPRVLLTRPANRLVAEIVRSVNVIPGIVMDGVADGAVLVRTSLGVLRVDSEPPFTEYVDLTIRPEQVTLIELDDRRENAMRGTVTSATRHGSYVAVVITPTDIDDATPVHLFVSEHVYRERELEPGVLCQIVLPPAAIHVMPRDANVP
jgi:ABC-type Fe3+/spermidine/putrescine transport system ATPase subunit